MVAAAKSLAELGLRAQGGRDARVTGLAVDSRQVQTGHSLFSRCPAAVSTAPSSFDLRLCGMGAAAVLTDRTGARDGRRCAGVIRASALVMAEDAAPSPGDGRGTLVRCAAGDDGGGHRDQRQDLGRHLHPADMAGAPWHHAGANLGTMGSGDFQAPLAHTTPEPITLHRHSGRRWPRSAASSPMRRWRPRRTGSTSGGLTGCGWRRRAFTNFSQDHLDYHVSILMRISRPRPDFSPACCRPRARCGRQHRRPARARVLADRVARAAVLTHRYGARRRICASLAQRFGAHGQDLRFSLGRGGRTGAAGADRRVSGGENVLAGGGAGNRPAGAEARMRCGRACRNCMTRARPDGAWQRRGPTVPPSSSTIRTSPARCSLALQSLRPHVMGR
jgi:UDP-N-acetylmuramoyl-L-alanyl-D-glutamate--2,6-diaminopimelate ligase